MKQNMLNCQLDLTRQALREVFPRSNRHIILYELELLMGVNVRPYVPMYYMLLSILVGYFAFCLLIIYTW